MRHGVDSREQGVGIRVLMAIVAAALIAGGCVDRYSDYPSGSSEVTSGDIDVASTEDIASGDADVPGPADLDSESELDVWQEVEVDVVHSTGYQLKSAVVSGAAVSEHGAYSLRSILGSPVFHLETSNGEYTLRSLVPWTGGQ